jgi:hypothetical protein
LAVTLARLFGELWGGPNSLFNRAPGGLGALVGIVWLIPVFGFLFARRLAPYAVRPVGAGRLLAHMVGAFLLLVGTGWLLGRLPFGGGPWMIAMVVGSALSIALAYRAWPQLSATLLAYGVAARVPVLVVMLLAMLGNWETHYDAARPDLPAMGVFQKWFVIGLVPQLSVWIAMTFVLGLLGGALALAVARPASRTLAEAR